MAKVIKLICFLAVTAGLYGCSGGGISVASPGSNGSTTGEVSILPAKITVQSVPMILDPTQVPPDPGPEKDNTIAGVDTNGNGIRDDVERWIAQTYPTSAKMRSAVAQRSLSLQRRLQSTNLSNDSAYQIAETAMAASSCSVETAHNVQAFGSSIDNLKKLISIQINTRGRLNAYNSFQRALGSRGLEVKDNGCDIPLNQLPN